MRFKLLHGSHQEPTGKGGKKAYKCYSPGEVVVTEVDLTSRFKNKFLKLADKANRRQPPVEVEPEAEIDEGEDQILTALHKGQGRWGVYNEAGEKVHEDWLKKAEAERMAADSEVPAEDEEE